VECLHCDPSQQAVAFEATAHCFAVWAYEPLEGGAMICPKAHRRTVFDLTADEWADTHLLLPRVRAVIDERVSPDGYNVGWNVMRAGGQTIDHAHLHIVPRWQDEPLAGKGLRWWIKQPENRRGTT
jgi:diadenosine tetraphosphate (Ap4A) HIT family hydrolase